MADKHERRDLTPEEMAEVQRLCDEEACVVLCDFVGEGELLMSEEFLECTPVEGQLRLLSDWITTLKEMHADLASNNREHFYYSDGDGPRTIN
jgi:hypothetical protein